jgi:cysteine synthase A
MIYNNAIELIGNTPLLRMKPRADDMAQVYIKLEKQNPGGSIKDRAALGMIEKAEQEGLLKPGDVIVEPTSGNTGIGLAMVGALKGYRVIIIMPDTMSVERRNTIKAFGAELILTDGALGMKGAIDKAYEITEGKLGYFIPQQFTNKANPERHYETTAREILRDVPDIAAFVAGVGTGGTVVGVGKKLKEYDRSIQIIAVEPASSPVLSGGTPGSHKIQGIGAGFVPGIYCGEYIDEIITITDEEAISHTVSFGREEGVLIGISSGANVAAALKVAQRLGQGKKVVTVAPDGGEKYLSMNLF